jgi:hypothetical protein
MQLGLAREISRSLVIRDHEIHSGIALFAVIAVIVVVQWAMLGFGTYDLVAPNMMKPEQVLVDKSGLSEVDQLYFSAITFTSVGYGDLQPRTAVGKSLAICEALMGMVHSVFFILVFLRGGTPHKLGCTDKTCDSSSSKPIRQ